MAERDDEVWLERALEDKRRSADVSSPPPGGFADVRLRRAQRRRQRRRETAIALAASVATLAALGTAGWWLWPAADDLPTTRSTVPLAAAPGPAGTTPPPPPSGGTVTIVAEEDARVRDLGDRIFAVDEGTVWFAVDPGSGRLEVRAPDRTVVVLGTVFAVRVDTTTGASGTTVGVLSGSVRVESPGNGSVELSTGQQLPPRATAALPLDAAWRARMTSLFPERAAREASLPAPRATIVAGKTQLGPAASGDAPSAGLPATAPPSTTVVANAPSPLPGSGSTTAPSANPPPAPGTPDAPAGQGAVAADAPAGTLASALPPPAPYTGPNLRPTPTWRDLYQQAWMRLPADPEGTASAIEVLVESAPSRAEGEEAMLALASIYHDNLRHFARSRTVYERYLARFPSGSHRRDVWMRLCLAYGETGDADKQRLCLRAFAVEFPESGR